MAESSTLPVLFVVDREPLSLAALVRDLTRRFGSTFTVSGESTPAAALAALEAIADAGGRVALLLVDDAATEMLAQAHDLHPRAKRVLLVDRDYSSSSPAVQAMALGRADFHIVRPWADDEMFYGPLSDYLLSWTREQEPSFELFRIVAAAGDHRVLPLRDVMSRFGLPYGVYPAESAEGRRLLETAGLDRGQLPAVIRYDGQAMVDPGLPDLARAVGVNVTNDSESCDLAIVGAGPAGLTAAVYASSEGLDTVMLDQEVSGGQAGTSPLIRNYPGFPHGVSGGVLMERTCEQAWLMGAHIIFAQRVVGLDQRGDDKLIHLADGTQLWASAVVLATGIEWRRVGVPSIDALVGSGVFYGAAVSESRAMQGQRVLIVGAGNSAGQAALHLAKHARTVTLIVRGDSLDRSMSRYLIREIESTPSIAVRLRTEAVDGSGATSLETVTVLNRSTGAVELLPADALFIMIGGQPNTQWLPDDIVCDRLGYIPTGRDLGPDCPQWTLARDPLTLETSMPGVFAAGDVRLGSIKRVASAVGEGATVVRMVHEYLRTREPALTP